MRLNLVLFATLATCTPHPHAIDGTQVKMDFARPDFWDAPFPSDDLMKNGRPDLSGFATRDVPLVGQVRNIASRSNGFATSGAIFFTLTEAIDPARLPDLAASIESASPVALIELDTGARYPIEISFLLNSEPYGTTNQLVLLPLQGIPLKPGTRYAAVVKRALTEKPLGVSQTMAEVAAGVSTLTDYNDAARTLGEADTIAGFALFTTARPADELAAFTTAAAALATPTVKGAWQHTQTFTDYCVYENTISMPNWQRGIPPYSTMGGVWPQSSQADPDRFEDARVLLTVPRSSMPAAGWPIVDFIGTGAGGERALVERGVWALDGGVTSGDGSGPAMHFARVGFAGITIDGPLWGRRNTTGGDEDYLIFNLNNLPALRDNLRQSALELTMHPSIIAGLQPDVSDCMGTNATAARFDAAHLAIWGHSMGATILPLAAANAPQFGAVILSGAGGSWIENIMYKEKPLQVRPIAELIAQIPDGTLTAFDPVLTLVQWAAEGADPPIYGEAMRSRHVLMEQGIIDHYILPRIANATSLSLKLNLASPPHDGDPMLVDQQRLEDLLPFSGGAVVTLPSNGNTVVQNLGDGVLDAHEVIYQLDGPMHQYRCFLKSWAATGTAVVVPSRPADSPCP